MPTYEYLCQSCSTVYEEQRTFAQADKPSRCPQCKSRQVRRLLSTFITFSPGSGMTAGNGGCACSAGGACTCSAAPAHK